MLYGFHAAQILLAFGAALLIRRRVAAVRQRLDSGPYLRRAEQALRAGDEDTVERLVGFGAGTGLGALLEAASDAARHGGDPHDTMRLPLTEMQYQVLRGFRATRAMASIASVLALVGAMAHWFHMEHGNHGIRGLSLELIRADAIRGSTVCMAIGLATAGFVYASRAPLRREALARRAEAFGAAARLAEAVDPVAVADASHAASR